MEKRSNDLQKYKEFEDEEFKIVGITSGEGREENAIIYICEVKNPKSVKTFEVRPRGSIKKRIQDMAKGEKFYIGKELTVRYKQLSELNVPVPPVGIVVREDK
jgi:ATP-dependent DNA ligase